jgi:hypothetical protein
MTIFSSRRHPEVQAKRASKGSSSASTGILRGPRSPVIGPATAGRTRWRPPQDDERRASIIVLAAPLRARAMPTPSREARRSGSFAGNQRGGDPGFSKPYAVFAISNSTTIKIGSRTPTNAGTTCRTGGCGAAQRGGSSVGVPPRLSPKRLVIPKAQLQARLPGTWQGVRSGKVETGFPKRSHASLNKLAGVTRLRLSQSREAPPAPVVMPGDMMPKPPGNRVDSPIRGHRTRSAARKSPSRRRPY